MELLIRGFCVFPPYPPTTAMMMNTIGVAFTRFLFGVAERKVVDKYYRTTQNKMGDAVV
jgi:hypothetical protein